MINNTNWITRTMFLTFTYTLFTFGAFAQKDVNLPDIEIQENRLDIPFSEQARSIEILTHAEIQSYPAVNLAELLQFVGGLDIKRRGPNGVQADISLRGSTFEQVLVLINGVKIIDPQTSHHVMNLPIDMEIIDRIEIIKGPAGRIYGQGAFAGAINIVTKVPTKTSASISGMYGKYNLFGLKANGNYNTKKWNTYASYNYEQTNEGYRKYNDYARHSAFVQSEFKTKKASYHFLGSYMNNGFGANSFYAAPGDSTSYEQVNTLFLSLQTKYTFGATQIKPAISYRNNADNYVFRRENPSFYQNQHYTNVASAQLNASTLLGKTAALGYGIEFRNEAMSSNNLGDRSRNVFTANLEYKWYLFNEKLKLIPGVSYNYYDDIGQKFLYGIDGSIQMTKSLALFANYGTTYRIPSYTELYYSDSRNVGNSNLAAENAINYEAGLKYISKKYFGQVSYFRRNGTDIIDWINTPFTVDTSIVYKWRPDNITELPIQGIDFSGVIQVGKISFLSPLRILRLSYTFIDGNAIQLPSVESRYSLEHISHQINVSSSWSILKTLKFSSNYRYIDRITMNPYHVWDFGFGLRYKRFQIDYLINNAFNKEYEEYPGIPMPTRWSRISLKIKLVK